MFSSWELKPFASRKKGEMKKRGVNKREMKSVCEQKNEGVHKRDRDEVVLIVFEFYCLMMLNRRNKVSGYNRKKIMIFVALSKVW